MTYAKGKRVQGGQDFYRLRRLNSITISRDSKTSNEMMAAGEINRIIDAMALPVSVRNQAQELIAEGSKRE